VAIQYGVTPQGYVAKQQSVIISELQAALQSKFGQSINLLPESVFGNIVGIFSEREATQWQLGEAVYQSQYPFGAEGTSVDNLLAINNLKRLPASATVTAPTDTNGVPGLVMFGTPGTVIPQGSIISVNGNSTITFKTDFDSTIAAAVNAVQTLIFTSMPTMGAFTISIVDPGGSILTSGSIPYTATGALNGIQTLSFSAVPDAGAFSLALGSLTTTSLLFSSTASDVQTAINALTGFSAVTVSGSFGGDFIVTFPSSASAPLMTYATNTLTNTSTPVVAINTATDSIQAEINALQDSDTTKFPYTDVTVTGTFGTGFTVNFGAGTPTTGNPSSGNQAQALFTFPTNTLQNGSTVVNIAAQTTTAGNPAQVIGSATCTATGPNYVPAGYLTVIGSPVAGWASVTNPLDCITGSNIESDSDALARRATLLAAQANGPLQAIREKVAQVAGVTQVIGFENVTQAALQLLTFSAVPTSGSFSLAIVTQLGPTETTSAIPFSANSAGIETAIQALNGFDLTKVSGAFSTGFTIDFNGSDGGQPQNLFSIPSNSLMSGSVGVSATTAFGRPGKSFEIVVSGGDDQVIATTIFNSKPAGIQAYGNTNVTVQDVALNTYNIGFSRPSQVPIYVTISLITDLTTAVNPTFIPGSVQQIQQEIVAIGNAFTIGGLIIGFGSNGLIGAFNDVPGILNYTLLFGRTNPPTSNDNIQLAVEEVPLFETFTTIVSYV
jgi:uncharacterized phage protein gp47/JayE